MLVLIPVRGLLVRLGYVPVASTTKGRNPTCPPHHASTTRTDLAAHRQYLPCLLRAPPTPPRTAPLLPTSPAGEGRVTAEGERIPVRCEQLDIGYIDGMLLLPLIIEHTIGGRRVG